MRLAFWASVRFIACIIFGWFLGGVCLTGHGIFDDKILNYFILWESVMIIIAATVLELDEFDRNYN